MPSNPRYLISGGGTGGHIFPAIAIADALKARLPHAEFLFVGAKGRMEMEKVPEAGYPITGLWISGLQRSLTLKNLSFPFKLISSLLKAGDIINDFKPDVVIGTGGYASGPILRMAARKGIPTLILEQNSYPGITNKLLGNKVNTICVAYPGMDRFFPKDKLVETGNPIRKEILSLVKGNTDRNEALRFFNLQPDKPVLLVIGGSLGARTINQSMAGSLELLVQHGVQMIWQTGKSFFREAELLTSSLENKGIHVYEFIKRMDLAYTAADVAISRAGAIAISELCLVAKPAILVPSPNVAEDHQTKNARALADRNAAIMVADIDAPDQLGNEVIKLIQTQEKQALLSTQIKKLAHENATELIVDQIVKLNKNNFGS